MEYKLMRSKRKTISISITPKLEVVVKCPNKCSLKLIDKVVKEKEAWILSTKEKIKEANSEYDSFSNLSKIMLLGKSYDVIDTGKSYIIGENYIKHKMTSNKEKIVKDFLIKFANNYISSRCEILAENMGVKYKSIDIISARKKWGSCDNLKKLKFNYRLIMIEPSLIDYVIYHELCHIIELNHSKKFWQMLQQLGYEKNDIRNKFKPYNFVLNLF